MIDDKLAMREKDMLQYSWPYPRASCRR